MANYFTSTTQKIVDAHKADFNCTNYKSVLKKLGGYDKYIESLGGVFSKYRNFNGKVKTIQQYHEICEYVFGLFAIYGFDYSNGSKYVRWAGGSPFYVGNEKGACNAGSIDDLCGLSSKSKTTCCNWAIDSLLKKMGWLPNGKQIMCTQASYGELITNKKDLRPGDIVHFYHDYYNKFNAKDTSTYSKSGWHHVVMVWSVSDTTVTVIDGGSRLQYNAGKFLYEVPRNCDKDCVNFGGTYGNDDKWLARRIGTLVNAKPTAENKTIDDLAIEVILGHDINGATWGNDPLRSGLLGNLAEKVQARVNELLKDEKLLQRTLAVYVLEGKASSGSERKAYLGDDKWKLAQDCINSVKVDVDKWFADIDEDMLEVYRLYVNIYCGGT